MVLEVKDATLSMDGRTVFTGLSFVACEGQLTRVTVGSHADATLLARVLTGFVALDSGFVTIDGELLTPYSARAFRRLMTYLPDENASRPPAEDFVPSLEGLDQVWAISPISPMGRMSPMSSMSRIGPMGRMSLANKLVIAANPPSERLEDLKKLAEEGRVVVVVMEN